MLTYISDVSLQNEKTWKKQSTRVLLMKFLIIMINSDFRDLFKYKKFKLSSDNSIIYFDLTQVWKNEILLGNYLVKIDNDEYYMTFEPTHLGPFKNIWVIFKNGEKFILNIQMNKLMTGDTVALMEISEEGK